jgi:hypothetical protein
MTDDDKTTATIGFMNKSAQEMQAFLSKLRTKTRSKSPNTFALYNFAVNKKVHGIKDDALIKAQADLYDLIITHTKSDSLLTTLGASTYEDQGVTSLQYIIGCWSTGGNETKEKNANQEYLDSLTVKPGITSSELRAKFNEQDRLRADLKGTDREVTDPKYCKDIQDMVSNISDIMSL